MSANNRISPLVSSQLPAFVRSDHPTFVAFMKAYYEYLEQSGKIVNRGKNIQEYLNIDETITEFSDQLYKTFIDLIPKDAVVDKDLLVKNIQDFYHARGSEKSLKFLLRVLFGQDAEIYYPKRDILRASDGKWTIEKSLKLRDIAVDGVANTDATVIANFLNKKITGNTSNASAYVERTLTYYDAGVKINELILSNEYKTFSSGTDHTLSANIFSGIISSVTIVDAGTQYSVGDEAVIKSDSGSGAVIRVADVSTGNIATITTQSNIYTRLDSSNIAVTYAGAGFTTSDYLSITGGGGTGANAIVSGVLDDGSVHPNTYNLFGSVISLEANTAVDNAVYSNLNTGTANANTALSVALHSFVFSNVGPVRTITVQSAGTNYISTPSMGILSNNYVRSLGILGRMEILEPGTGYAINDKIDFLGGAGTGASANVSNVDANGAITTIEFEAISGFPPGGLGYSQTLLPTANVITTTGSGAVINVAAILGDGEILRATTTDIGKINRLQIVSGGSGYATAPTIDFSGSGDGEANVTAQIVTGIFTYPGRFTNDDGFLSGYNFIQDRHYYQNYSYVVKLSRALASYKDHVMQLTHPAGMKLFGEYLFETIDTESRFDSVTSEKSIFTPGTYSYTSGNITFTLADHGASTNDQAYIEFDGNLINDNNIFTISNVISSSTFNVATSIANTGSGNAYISIIN